MKYLGEIIKEEGIEFGSNTLIVSPVGSGKTYYILNDLTLQSKRVLYLCDNSNLKYQVKKDVKEAAKEAGINIMDKLDIMSYKRFGIKVKNDTLNEFINSFDMIVCDEIHNLVDYQTFKDDADLLVARVKLFDKYENTKIVFFTATPYYLEQLEKDNKKIGANFSYYNFSEHPNIKRFIEKRLAYINHISQIQFQLDQYEQSFKYRNVKCLM